MCMIYEVKGMSLINLMVQCYVNIMEQLKAFYINLKIYADISLSIYTFYSGIIAFSNCCRIVKGF